MSRIVPLRPWHLRLIEPQQEQALLAAPQLNERFGEAVLAAGQAWACVDSEQVYAAAGFVFDEGQAKAWAILSRTAGARMVTITRAARRIIGSQAKPVQALVRDGFAEGEKWAAMLGFERSVSYFTVGPDGHRYDKWVFNG